MVTMQQQVSICSHFAFVYEKTDNEKNRTRHLDIKHAIYISERRTNDFQTTSNLRKI
jgi:hypothetical protein